MSSSDPLWRFEFDNDVLAESDDFFTAGWSLQRHIGAADWETIGLWRASQWIVDTVPGLRAEPGMEVRKAIGVGQVIQTPGDLTQSALIEDDIPYAGVLGVANSWAVISDEKMNVFQFYVGVLGPPSLAEQVQKFVHNDLNMGKDPKGWDNQLDTEPILNLNYGLSRKLWNLGDKNQGFAGDFAYGGGAGLGNLFTYVQGGVQARAGWNLPEGFAHVPDVAGRGVIVDPVIVAPEVRTHLYFSAVARASGIAHTVLLDGNSFSDSHSVDYDPYMLQLILGTHLQHGRMGFHFNIYLSSNPVKETAGSDLTWTNLSFEYRF